MRGLRYKGKFLFVFLLLFAGGCGLLNNSLLNEGVIVFGTGTYEEGITEEKDSFAQSEDILIETELSEPFGTTEISYILLKITDSSEEIYDQWTDVVDPSWDTLLSEFHLVNEYGELDVGDYTLRMFKHDSELIAEGSFSVH